jgi:hypothetical protein
MPSPGMLRHVALVRTDFSEERSASIIRVTSISDLGTPLARCEVIYLGSVRRLLVSANVVRGHRFLSP